MATAHEIETFLENFKVKSKVFDLIFRDDRSKNTQSLLDLELSVADRKRIIFSIVADDYSKGPVKDELYRGSDMWVFKKMVKACEVYIKISMGFPNNSTICISFHT
jgi:hypothetical protein